MKIYKIKHYGTAPIPKSNHLTQKLREDKFFASEAEKVYKKLLNCQKALDPDAESILYDNLWDLYE